MKRHPKGHAKQNAGQRHAKQRVFFLHIAFTGLLIHAETNLSKNQSDFRDAWAYDELYGHTGGLVISQKTLERLSKQAEDNDSEGTSDVGTRLRRSRIALATPQTTSKSPQKQTATTTSEDEAFRETGDWYDYMESLLSQEEKSDLLQLAYFLSFAQQLHKAIGEATQHLQKHEAKVFGETNKDIPLQTWLQSEIFLENLLAMISRARIAELKATRLTELELLALSEAWKLSGDLPFKPRDLYATMYDDEDLGPKPIKAPHGHPDLTTSPDGTLPDPHHLKRLVWFDDNDNTIHYWWEQLSKARESGISELDPETTYWLKKFLALESQLDQELLATIDNNEPQTRRSREGDSPMAW